MKVLYVINSLNVGGAEKLIVDIITELMSDGIMVDVYLLNEKDTQFKRKLIEKKVNIFSTKTNSYKSFKHILWLIKNAKNYDIIHSHLSYSQYYVSLIKLVNKKVKLVTTEHNTFNERRNYKIFSIVEKNIYNKYDRIVAINEDTKNSLEYWLDSVKDKIIVINNGVDIEFYKKRIKSNKVNIYKNCLYKIVMVAAFRKQKNHELIVRAMNLLPDEYELLLIGDGECRHKIEELIEICNLKNRITLLGIRDDIPEILKECDVFVLPSKWEGFGLVAVEAMAAGLPVIASDVKGLSSVVGDAGILFDNTSEKELANKIKMVCDDKKLQKSLINKGLIRCEDFSLEKTKNKHIELYKSLIK